MEVKERRELAAPRPIPTRFPLKPYLKKSASELNSEGEGGGREAGASNNE